MNKGWLELESDPGLFTLLVEDFGVKGVQVEEIYDLQKTIDGPVYGFIFLFRWIEERRSRRKTTTEEESFVQDENIVNNLFFAQQIIPNSCASHALLSVLLNNDRVKLGDVLSKLKEFSKGMSPEDKGNAIGNMPELASAHNSHARPEPRHLPEKQQGISAVRTMETFHFVSYVPINGHLFELDGLKPYPIDHGPWEKDEYWTEKFRRVITERLGMATGGEPYHDIRFNLMAVVPDKRQLYEHKLATLKTNRQIVLEALQQMVKVTNPGLTSADKEKYMEAIRQDRMPEVKQSSASVAMDTSKITNEKTESCLNVPDKTENNVCNDKNTDVKMDKSDKEEMKGVVKDSNTVESNVGQGQSVINSNDQSTSTAENTSADCDDKNSKDLVSDILEVRGPLEGSGLPPTSVGLTDITKPLTIETKFSGSGSSGPNSESTDTASETGSCFSSPSSTFTSCQNSPQLSSDISPNSKEKKDCEVKSSEDGTNTRQKHKHRFSNHQAFTPKDLLALLKNVENEITLCEANLKDEIEKRRKYQIDDCRRTHNYDQFICTILSMLAKEGHLADLVEQQLQQKKRSGSISSSTPQPDKRKRPRPKRRR